MTKRTFTTKSETVFEWDETLEVVEAVKNLTKFAGNHCMPTHPDLKKKDG